MSSSREIDWVTTYSLSYSDGSDLNKQPPKKYRDILPKDNISDNHLATASFASLASKSIASYTLQYPLQPQQISTLSNMLSTSNQNINNSTTPINTNLSSPTTIIPPQQPTYTHETTPDDVILQYLFSTFDLTSEKCFIQLASYWYRGTFYTQSDCDEDYFSTSNIYDSHDAMNLPSTNTISPQHSNHKQPSTSPILGSMLESIPPSALVKILSFLTLDELLALLPTSKIFLLAILSLLLSPQYRQTITNRQYLQLQQLPLTKDEKTQNEKNYQLLQNTISTHLTTLQTSFLDSRMSSTNGLSMLGDDDDDLSLDDLLNGSNQRQQQSSISTTSQSSHSSLSPRVTNTTFGSFQQFGHGNTTTTAENAKKFQHQYLEALLLDCDAMYKTTIHYFTKYEQNTVIMPQYYHTYPVFTPIPHLLAPKTNQISPTSSQNGTTTNNNIQTNSIAFTADNGHIININEDLDDDEIEITKLMKKDQMKSFFHCYGHYDTDLCYEFPSLLDSTTLDPNQSLDTTPASIISKRILFEQQQPQRLYQISSKYYNENGIEMPEHLQHDEYYNDDENNDENDNEEYEDHIQNYQQYVFKYSTFNQQIHNQQQLQFHQLQQSTQPITTTPQPQQQQSTPTLRPITPHTPTSTSSQQQSSLSTTQQHQRHQTGPIPPSPTLSSQNGGNHPNQPNSPQLHTNSFYNRQRDPIIKPSTTTYTHDLLHEFPHLGQSWGRWSTKRGLIWSLFYLPDHFQRLYDITTMGILDTRSKFLQIENPYQLHPTKLQTYHKYINAIYICLSQKDLYHYLGVVANKDTQLIFCRFFSLLPHNSLYREWIRTNNYEQYSKILIPTQIIQILLFESIFSNLKWNPTLPLLFHLFQQSIQEKLLQFGPETDITLDISHSIMKDCNRTLINKSCRCYFKDNSGLYFGTLKPWFAYYYRMNLLHFPMATKTLCDENADLSTQHIAYNFKVTNVNNNNNSNSNNNNQSNNQLGGNDNIPMNRKDMNNNRTIRQQLNQQNNDFTSLNINTNLDSTISSSTNNVHTQNSISQLLLNDDLRGCEHCNDLSNSCLCILLHCIAYSYPDVGYCQGMNFITAQLLLQCDMAVAFNMLLQMLKFEQKENVGTFTTLPPTKISLLQLPSYIPIEYQQQINIKHYPNVEQPLPICFEEKQLYIGLHNDDDEKDGKQVSNDDNTPESTINNNKQQQLQQNPDSTNNTPSISTSMPFITKTIQLPYLSYSTTQQYLNINTLLPSLNAKDAYQHQPIQNHSLLQSHLSSQQLQLQPQQPHIWYLKPQPLSRPLQHRLFFTSNLLGWHLCRYIFITLLRLYIPTLFLNLKRISFPIALLTDWFMTLLSSPSMHISPSFNMVQPQVQANKVHDQQQQQQQKSPSSSVSGLASPNSTPRTPNRIGRSQQISTAAEAAHRKNNKQQQNQQNAKQLKKSKKIYEFHSPIATFWDYILLHGEIILYRFVIQLLLLGTKHYQLDQKEFDGLHEFKSQHVMYRYLCDNKTIRRKILKRIDMNTPVGNAISDEFFAQLKFAGLTQFDKGGSKMHIPLFDHQ